MRGRPSAEKRRKEIGRQDKKKEKAARREQRKLEKASAQDSSEEDIDPDIAGIVPGPQPLPWDEDEAEGPRASVDAPSRERAQGGPAVTPARRS